MQTPITDKAEYEVRLGRHRRMVVRPELCRELERQLQIAETQRDELRRRVRQLIKHRGHVAEEVVFEKLVDLLPKQSPMDVLSRMKPLPEHLRGCELRSKVASSTNAE